METHHTKTPRKKISHYLFEFFMLFLAITLGFYVDNRREHYVEHQREKEYMHTLVEDLKADVRMIAQVREKRIVREEKLGRLILLLGDKNLDAQSEKIYQLADSTDNYESFLRNDRTIQQLKTAGGMRMIRKNEVSAAIMEYDNFIVSEVDWNNRTEAARIDKYKELRFQLFDVQALYRTSMGNGATVINPYHLLSASPVTINTIAGALFQVKRISETCRESCDTAMARAQRLIKLVSEEYHIKDSE